MRRSLRDCYAKIDRADEHITNLATEVNVFLETKPYLIQHERDPKEGLVLRCHCDDATIQPKLIRFGVIAGEVFHHLRSSLNHLVLQLGRGRKTKKTEFPIFLKREAYKATALRKIDFIKNAEARALIKRVQPYNRLRSNDPLWLVHHLDIVDKHHVLIVAAGATVFWKQRKGATPIRGWSLEENLIPHYVSLKDGAIVAKPIGRPANMDFRSVEQVILPKISRIQPEPVVPRLKQVSEYVRALIARFEPFL